MHEQFLALKLRERGYEGSNQDIWWWWLESKGFIGPIPDAEIAWLESQGYTTGSLNDRYFRMYRDAGLTGTLDDMGLKYNLPEGGITPGPTDPVADPHWDDVVFFWNGEDGYTPVTGGTAVVPNTADLYENDLFGTTSLTHNPTSQSYGVIITLDNTFTLARDETFTIDFWGRNIPSQITAFPSFLTLGDVTTPSHFLYYGGSETRGAVHGGVWSWVSSGKGTLPIDRWVHLAFVYESTHVKTYIDGKLSASTSRGSTSSVNEITINTVGLASRIRDPIHPMHGRIDEVRVTKGVARWTEDFTRPSAPVLVP